MSTKTGDLKDLGDVGKKGDEPAKKQDAPAETGKTPPKPEQDKGTTDKGTTDKGTPPPAADKGTTDKGTTPPAPDKGTTPPAPGPGVTPPAPAKKVPAKGSADRGKVLYSNYVEKYHQDKADREAEVEKLKGKNKTASGGSQGSGSTTGTQTGSGAGGAAAQQDEKSLSDKMDSVFKYTDPIADVAGMLVTHASDGINLYGDSMGVMDKDASQGSNIAGAVTSGSSMLLNTYGTVRSGMETHKARTSGDKVGYRSGLFNTIGSTFSTMGDAATFGTALGSSLGGSDKSGDIGNVLAGFMGSVGSITSMFGSSYSTHKYRQGRNNLNKRATDASGMDTAKLSEQAKTALAGKNLDEYNAAQSARHTAKAKKYASAMGGAAADTKYKAGAWDTLGNVAGLVGGLTSLIGGSIGLADSSPIAKLVMTGIGALSNIVGSVAKTKNMISEHKRSSENKTKFVTEYIGEKKKKILDEANKGISDENEKVTDAEAENIAIARLGIKENDAIGETSTLSKNRDAIFTILVKKRAQNILQAAAATRKEILEDMGLDPEKATEDAIISALGG